MPLLMQVLPWPGRCAPTVTLTTRAGKLLPSPEPRQRPAPSQGGRRATWVAFYEIFSIRAADAIVGGRHVWKGGRMSRIMQAENLIDRLPAHRRDSVPR